MAAAPIQISIALNASEVAKGAKQSSDALEKVSGSLDAVASGSAQAGEKLEQSLKGAQKSTQQTEQDFKSMAQSVQRSEADATRSVQRAEREQTQAVELSSREQRRLKREGLNQVAANAKQAAALSATSLDGSLSGLTEAVSGASIGILSAMPPQLAAIGAAGVAAVSLITGSLERSDEMSQEFKEHVAELATELIKAGNDGSVSIEYVVDALQKLATETDSGKTKLSDLFAAAKGSGNSAKDLAQAYAGQTDKLKELTEAAKKKLATDKAAADAVKAGRANQNDANDVLSQTKQRLVDTANAQQAYTEYLVRSADAAKAAKKEQEQYAEAGGPELEAKAAAIKQINDAYDDAAGSVDDYVNAESGVLDTDKYIAAMQAKQKALQDYQTSLASSGLSTEAKAFLASQGEDAAATLLQGYVSGTAAQKQALANIWTEAGSTSSGAYNKALNDGFNKSVPGPKVVLPAPDLSGVTKAIDDFVGKNRTVVLKINGQYGRTVI